MAALGGPAVSTATLGRAVQALDWRQRKSVHAAEPAPACVKALRAVFFEAVQSKDYTYFEFVDETSTNLTYCRRYARAAGRQQPH